MILVDTSVWIDHLRGDQSALEPLLGESKVLVHPFVIGEMACGNLKNRAVVLKYLQNLPQAPVASQDEVLMFIESKGLAGRGIGYIDAHLLAATVLAADARLWTLDRNLKQIAAELGLASA